MLLRNTTYLVFYQLKHKLIGFGDKNLGILYALNEYNTPLEKYLLVKSID